MNEPTVLTTTLRDLTTTHLAVGSGQPVLLLHGWGASAKLMWPLAKRLAPLGYQVLAPDLPGFGDSAPPPSAWSVHDYAAHVLAYLDHQGIERAHFVGHSFGGRISLVIGAEHAGRIGKLVLINSAGVQPKRSAAGQLRLGVYKTLRDGLASAGMKGLSDRLRGWYVNRYGSADYKNAGALRETFVRVVNEDLLPYAARVQAPTLLLWGDADDETPLWVARRLEQTIPDAGLHVFSGAGHYSYLERLSETVHILDYFFKQAS